MIGYVQYGKLQLECTHVNSVRRDVLIDSAGNYYCTRWQIALSAILNPSATTYSTLNNGVPGVGEATPGRTDRLIHAYLSQPRRQLKLFTYDLDGSLRVYLESPPLVRGTPLPSDVKHGPLCTVHSIVETTGIKCWQIDCVFETFVNDCSDKYTPIIAHAWDTTVDYDDCHYATNTTRGEVLFHNGRLRNAQLTPDMFREQFLAVAPQPNFARDKVNIQIAADGCSASYLVVDVERPYNVGLKSPACRLEGALTTWVSAGSMASALARSAPQLNAGIGNLAPNWSDFIPGLGAYNRGRAIAGMGTTVLGNAVAELPKYYANVKCRAHGARATRRYDLARLCMALGRSWLNGQGGEPNLPNVPSLYSLAFFSKVILTQHLHENVVDLDMTLMWSDDLWPKLAGLAGPAGSAGAILGQILTADDRMGRFLTTYYCDRTGAVASQNRPGLLNDPSLNQTSQAIGNRPVNTGQGGPDIPAGNNPPDDNSPYRNTRGPGSLEFILTAALLSQCETPQQNAPWFGHPDAAVPANGQFTVSSFPQNLLRNED